MSTYVSIPITNQPNQVFQCNVPVDGVNIPLGFFISWNNIAQYWMMTLYQNTTELIANLAMVNSNLLGQYQYLNVGQAFIVPLGTGVADYPGVSDWGNNFLLVWN
jgi:hypothetical protein